MPGYVVLHVSDRHDINLYRIGCGTTVAHIVRVTNWLLPDACILPFSKHCSPSSSGTNNATSLQTTSGEILIKTSSLTHHIHTHTINHRHPQLHPPSLPTGHLSRGARMTCAVSTRAASDPLLPTTSSVVVLVVLWFFEL
jgi:hypothetical protein